MGCINSTNCGFATPNVEVLFFSAYSFEDLELMYKRYEHNLKSTFAVNYEQFFLLVDGERYSNMKLKHVYHEVLDTDKNNLVDASEVMCLIAMLSRCNLRKKLAYILRFFSLTNPSKLAMEEVVVLIRCITYGLSKVEDKIIPPDYPNIEEFVSLLFNNDDGSVKDDITWQNFFLLCSTCNEISTFLHFWENSVYQVNMTLSQFKDAEFAPDDKSLFINFEKCSQQNDELNFTQWIHPISFTPDTPVLFQKQHDLYSSHDVKLGLIVNANFVAAISYFLKISNPMNLFILTGQEHLGRYCLRLFINEAWVSIYIDDSIPCLCGHPIYSSTAYENEIWLLLLEKACAKHFGSYELLNSASFDKVIKVLSGGLVQSKSLIFKEVTFEFCNAAIDKGNIGCIRYSNCIKEENYNNDPLLFLNDVVCSISKCEEIDGEKRIEVETKPWKVDIAPIHIERKIIAKEEISVDEEQSKVSPDPQISDRIRKLVSENTVSVKLEEDNAQLTTNPLDADKDCLQQSNPGNMGWNEFANAFHEVQVLQTFFLTDGWTSKAFTSEWLDTGGGSPNGNMWSMNPQFILSNLDTESTAKFFITVSKIVDQQMSSRCPDFENTIKQNGLGIAIVSRSVDDDEVAKGKSSRLTELDRNQVQYMTEKFIVNDTSLFIAIDLSFGDYTVIPMQYEASVSQRFVIRVTCKRNQWQFSESMKATVELTSLSNPLDNDYFEKNILSRENWHIPEFNGFYHSILIQVFVLLMKNEKSWGDDLKIKQMRQSVRCKNYLLRDLLFKFKHQ